MNRIIKILAVVLFLVAAYVVILYQFPKEASRFPFLVFLFFSDYYLWRSLVPWLARQRKVVRWSLSALYWLPLMLLSLFVGTRMIRFELIANERIGILFQGFIFSAYASKLLPILFLLLSDIINGIKFLIKAIHRKVQKNDLKRKTNDTISRSRFLHQIGLAGGGLLFFGLLAGMIKWVHDFRIHRHSLRLANLPKSFSGLKIVQISDLHLGSWTSKSALEEAVNIINEMKPDLIFLTGDLVNNQTDEVAPFEQTLKKLKARRGIFTVLGNHDYGDYLRWPSVEAKAENLRDLFRFFKRMNWKLLKNEHHLFTNHDGSVAVIGVENWGAIARFPQYGDLEKAYQGAEKADVKILLSHDPSHWDAVINKDFKDIDLTFSGHTHGFQFGIEMKNFKWSPAQYAYKQWAGLYNKLSDGEKTQYLYVNRGLGTVGYPGRVGILPEITLFELKA